VNGESPLGSRVDKGRRCPAHCM